MNGARSRPVLSACLVVVVLAAASCGTSSSNSTTQALLTSARAGIGDLTFVPDLADAATVSVSPTATTATTLSVVDTSGYTWNLSIAPHTFLFPTTVTLTSMEDVSITHPTSAVVGTGHFSGIVIGPSSLVFADPATLALTAPRVQSMAGGSGGTAVPTPTPSGNAGSTTVVYVPNGGGPGGGGSGTGSGADDNGLVPAPVGNVGSADVDEPGDVAQGTYPPGTKPPHESHRIEPGDDGTGLGSNSPLLTPPAVDLHCIGGPPSSDDIGGFVADAQEPESQLISALLWAQGGDQAGGLTAAQRQGVERYLHRIASRIENFVQDNPKDESAFYAVTFLALSIAKEAQPFDDTTDADAVTNAVVNWGQGLLENSVKKLKDGHDLTEIPEVVYMNEILIGLGRDDTSLITGALQFDMNVNETTYADGLNPGIGGAAIFNVVVGGVVLLEAQALAITGVNVVLGGKATLTYSTKQLTLQGNATPPGSMSAAPFSTTISAALSDVCTAPKLQVTQHPYGGREVITLVGYGTYSQQQVQSALQGLVQYVTDRASSDTVPLTVMSGATDLASHTFSYSVGGAGQDGTSSKIAMSLGYNLKPAVTAAAPA